MPWMLVLFLGVLLAPHESRAETDALPRHFSVTASLAGPLRTGGPPVAAHAWHGAVGIDATAVYRFCRWIGVGVHGYDVLANTTSASRTALTAQAGLGLGVLAESAIYRIPDYLDISVQAGVEFDFRPVEFNSRLTGQPVGGRDATVGAQVGVHLEYMFAPMLAVGVGLRYQWFPDQFARDSSGNHYRDSLAALWPMASITIPAR